MSSISVHDEWLSLIEISGPFLAVPVLKEVFPQGLEELNGLKRKRLRQAYEEWREALETDDPQFPELHAAWIDEVLARGLELDEDGTGDALKQGEQVPASLRVTLPEHGVTLAPDLAVVDSSQGDKPLMLINTYAADIDLEGSIEQDGWAASPAERMVQLCRMTGCRIGLITNGECWMLVDAPVGAVTTFASWYARIWGQEPITLQAFVHLLGIRRFFFDQSDQLPALFDRSLKYQDEVTEALGEQVRRAVEVLIQSLDKADQDRNRELLRDVAPAELYEAGLTVMMRLVFLLSAEERGLLLLGDERYETNYAISTLRMQLRTESEDILERRWDAWSRLLATFRAVFGGIEHENLRLPALGGSLFDPDRFPFLEGRAKGSLWRTDVAKPLPIDNRTVLLLLEAIQQFHGRTLSYRALDVEQIGYVYEGLLERTVKRTSEVTLELDATKSAKTPWVKLGELESAKLDGANRLAELLLERSGSSVSRIRNDLAKTVDDILADRLLTACQGDLSLRNRIKPYAHLLRSDPWGYPLVYPKGAFIVTTGSDRSETGTHYTPKSLTEAIVAGTLTPIAYVGPSEGKPKEEWVLKSPAELLDLKVCDPAMGSGAFLVQACRWLSDRLAEAWSQAEVADQFVTVDGEVVMELGKKEPLPRDAEARTVIARRLIAERCLYGVDLNPLAVELAKLSIWLVTLAKGRPFGFLDHNLRCGDSLLGIHRLDQLTELTMNPGQANTQMRVFGHNIEQAAREAIELRQRLREMPIRDIHDVEAMARLDGDARRRLDVPERLADAFIGEVFSAGGNGAALEAATASLAIQAEFAIHGDVVALKGVIDRAGSALSTDLAQGRSTRRPFHWPLEFPEVFIQNKLGFDAIVGNPPFLGGRRIRAAHGISFLNWLTKSLAPSSSGNADLCAFFFRRASTLLKFQGCAGLLATNTISQGDTKSSGLDELCRSSSIFSAVPSFEWPGRANLTVSIVFFSNGPWNGEFRLSGSRVKGISSSLIELGDSDGDPCYLRENSNKSFQGSIVLGKGFVLNEEQVAVLIKSNPKNKDVLFKYLRGEDFTSSPNQTPLYWVINFFDWPLAREDAPENYKGPVAQDYPDCLKIIDDLVRPERTRVDSKGQYVLRKPLPQKWWIYSDKRPALYKAIHDNKRVMFHSFTGKYVAFAFVPVGYVYAGPHNVFSLESYSDFAVLQSILHQIWAWKYCSTLETRLRYANRNLFETFPFPRNAEILESIGEAYYEERQAIMLSRQEGMTDTYNRLNDPGDLSPDIRRLREMQKEMDIAVVAAYGWIGVELEHGFHSVAYLPENDRVRFTISESARMEMLRRLFSLNRQRFDEEVVDALHESPALKAKSNLRSASHRSQGELVFAKEEKADAADLDAKLLDWLRSNLGWHAKDAILTGSGVPESRWNTTIRDLLERDLVERQGERHGARYQASADGGAGS